jgi:hypothetical protein
MERKARNKKIRGGKKLMRSKNPRGLLFPEGKENQSKRIT